MSLETLYSMPGHIVRRAQQLHTALFAQELADLDLTSVQYALLVAINDLPGSDATRLAGLIAFDRATTGDVLQRLADKGLVRRDVHPSDRRVKVATLTQSGEALLKAATPRVKRVQQRMMQTLSEADAAQLVDLLHSLISARSDQIGG